MTTEPIDVDVLVLGAGLCGIAAAAACLKDGVTDIVIIERADAVGGTWLHNHYPGCAVDVPGQAYSFSWAPRSDWSRIFPVGDEIRQYLEDVVDSSGIRPLLRLGTELIEARWDDDARRWIVTTNRDTYRARVFVSAAGPLHEAQIPDLDGRDDFAGPAFHSSEWPDDLDLTGKRVAVVGTGASAIQFVPKIARQASQVTVLQRTASWVVPKPDRRVSKREQRFLEKHPLVRRANRFSQWLVCDALLVGATKHRQLASVLRLMGRVHLRRQVSDPATRAALTPAYAPTCKRVGLSNSYLRAFNRSNVELVTEAAERVHADGIETAGGRRIPADVIVWGTGFHTLPTHPINQRIVGADGRSLEDHWAGSPTAYLGTSVSGFPNLFLFFGPNIGTVSGFVMAEAQATHLRGALRAMRMHGLDAIDVKSTAVDEFVAECDEALKNSTFVTGGCNSYYLSVDGSRRVSLVWPHTMATLRRRLRRFDLRAYEPVPTPVSVLVPEGTAGPRSAAEASS